MIPKLQILIGTGGIGTITAYALETRKCAEVTAVLRSNYLTVKENGFSIDSVDYGWGIREWRAYGTVSSCIYMFS